MLLSLRIENQYQIFLSLRKKTVSNIAFIEKKTVLNVAVTERKTVSNIPVTEKKTILDIAITDEKNSVKYCYYLVKHVIQYLCD